MLPLYYLHWFDHAAWFYEFRSLPCTELTAAGAGLFAGALAELVGGPKLLIRPLTLALLCLGIALPHLKPILAPVAVGSFADHWQDGVCLQSTRSSCGAASAATVFKALGVNLTEREIAQECLTYAGGTENWYLARAFRRRGFTVTYRFEQGVPRDLHTPAIAGVRVGGNGHFIPILTQDAELLVTGDPLVGREVTARDQATDHFAFTGFFMEILGSACKEKK